MFLFYKKRFTFLVRIFAYSFLCLTVTFPVFSKEVSRVPALQCPIPIFPQIDEGQARITDERIVIRSKSTVLKTGELASFGGGVTLLSKDHRIIANELTFNNITADLSAEGNIQYQNSGLNIFAETLKGNTLYQETSLTEASYQLLGNPGHGSAGLISIGSINKTLTLIDSTYTTCVGEVPDWEIEAGEIVISPDRNIGQVYHAKFKVLDIPIFYLPYFSFPVSEDRVSGFLYPTIGSSSDAGLEISTPYYVNIAENMDATITPHYMSKRGLQLLTEFRYLAGQQSGQIDIEYLNKDNALVTNKDPRYLARLQHVGTFYDNFRVYADFTTISDDNYLVDLDSTQYNANDAYLYQIGELSYFGDNWQSTIKLQDFEVLGDHIQSYQTIPHFDIAWQQPLESFNAQFELYSELSRFETPDLTLPNANRYHVEGAITIPVTSPAWFFNSEFKVLQTYYQQENIAPDSLLEETVSRTLPKIRFHGGINLEQPVSLFKQDYIQTLEPQLQYLYVGDQDQSNIGIYDTTLLQDDFDGLFRDRRHSGLDRIAQANQYSWGLTSRLLDTNNTELLRLSVGRISYINSGIDEQNSESESALAADLYFRLNQQWQIRSDLQYDTNDNKPNKSQVKLDYHFNNKNLIQVSHRYTRNVLQGNGLAVTNEESLQQGTALASFALDDKWSFIGRITQDFKQKRSLETYAGLQYESCCWAVRIAYHRHINSIIENDDMLTENRDEFDSGFMVKFVIKGLDGKQTSVGTEDMFNSSIFGYKRPYFLNN